MEERQLKFRVWDKLFERYVKGDLFFEQMEDGMFEGDCYHDKDGEIHSLKYSQRKLDRYHGYVIQQWTGLTDKNENEVYEGDLIQYVYDKNPSTEKLPPYPIGEVYYFDGSFRSKNSEGALLFSPARSVVVGNIFENKDLIK